MINQAGERKNKQTNESVFFFVKYPEQLFHLKMFDGENAFVV